MIPVAACMPFSMIYSGRVDASSRRPLLAGVAGQARLRVRSGFRDTRASRRSFNNGSLSSSSASITLVAHIGSRPTRGAHLQSSAAAVGKTQEFVIETVFLIPGDFKC